MKRETITRMLDAVNDEYISQTAVFDPGYIQEVPKRIVHMKKKRIITFALAAALILALGAGAYAIGRSWSHGMDRAYETASEEEKQAAEASGLVTAGVLASDSKNGVTVSAVDMSNDAGRAFVIIRVEGVEYPGDMHTEGETGNGAQMGIRPETTFHFDFLRNGEKYGGEEDWMFAEHFEETGSYVAPDGSLEFVLDLRYYNGGEIRMRVDRIECTDLRLDAETYDSTPPATMAEGPWELRWTPGMNSSKRVVSLHVPFHEDDPNLLNAVIYPSAITFFGEIDKLTSMDRNSHVLLTNVEEHLAGVKLNDGTEISFSLSSGESFEDDVKYDYRYDLSTIIQPEQVAALIFTSDDGKTRAECPVEDSDVIYVSDREVEEILDTTLTTLDLSACSVSRTPEWKAAEEWDVFYWAYTESEEGKRAIDAADAAEKTTGEIEYELYVDNGYFVYTAQMADKLEQIAEKYGLKLVEGGEHELFDWEKDEQELKARFTRIFPNCGDWTMLNGSFGYYFNNGSFQMAWELDYPAGTTDGPSNGFVNAVCLKKGYMPWIFLGSYISELDTAETWEYVTAGGTKVVLVSIRTDAFSMRDPRGMIFADLDGCLVEISSSEIYSKSTLEALADRIDFSAF